MSEQLVLFEEIRASDVVVQLYRQDDYVGNFAILKEYIDNNIFLSSEKEKKGLIEIYEVKLNCLATEVLKRCDDLNYKLKAGVNYFYQWTDLWRLEYLMPLTYRNNYNQFRRGE